MAGPQVPPQEFTSASAPQVAKRTPGCASCPGEFEAQSLTGGEKIKHLFEESGGRAIEGH